MTGGPTNDRTNDRTDDRTSDRTNDPTDDTQPLPPDQIDQTATMYAIFEAKGKQFRADPDGTIRMPSIDAEPGDRLTFDRVLLAERDGGEVLVGRPSVDGASVSAEVVRHGKGEKIVVYKMKRRKGYRRKQGHRQQFTEVRIVEIDLDGASAPAPDAETAAAEVAETPEAEVAREVAPEADEVAEAAEEEPVEEAEPEGEKEDVSAEEEAPEPEAAEETPEPEAAEETPEPEAAEVAPEPEPEAEEPEAVIPEDVAITGAAREIAEEHGLDVTKIEGTGKDGRILKADAEAAVEEQKSE